MKLPLARTFRRRRLAAQAHTVARPDGGLSLTLPLAAGTTASAWLVRTASLPGNARVARRGADTRVVAEVDDPAAAQSILDVLLEGAVELASDGPGYDAARIAALLAKARVRADAIVPRDGGCEVRVPTGSVVRPVLVFPEPGGVRCTHVFSDPLPADCESLADHALRCNERARHARLALADDRVRAEARLAAAALSHEILARTVRAVAALATHTAFSLQVLGGDGAVRAHYAHIVLGLGPNPTQSKETP